jgi:hypothetical protein
MGDTVSRATKGIIDASMVSEATVWSGVNIATILSKVIVPTMCTKATVATMCSNNGMKDDILG